MGRRWLLLLMATAPGLWHVAVAGSAPSVIAVTANVAAPLDNARALTGPFDFTLSPGQQAQFDITFENTGATTWTAAGAYVLRQIETNASYPLGACDPRSPGSGCAWTFFLVGDPAASTSTRHYRMFRGETGFGDTIAVTIHHLGLPTVTGTTSPTPTRTATPTPTPTPPPGTDHALALTGPFSFTLAPGEEVGFDVHFMNIGSTTWTSAEGYGMRITERGTTYSLGMPFAQGGCDGLPPGRECVWHPSLIAGSVPETGTWHYRMHRGSTAFGDAIAVSFTVVVASTPIPLPTQPPTPTPTATVTVGLTQTPTRTATLTSSPSLTLTRTATRTATSTPSVTPSTTRTPTATPSPTAPAVGGRDLGIRRTAVGTYLSWVRGLQQTGYLVVRWSPTSGFAFFPSPTSFLAGDAVAYVDFGTPPDEVYCYVLLVLGGMPPSVQQVLAISDLLCVYPRTGTAGGPANFHLELNQSAVAQLTWDGPGGQSDYRLTTSTFDGTSPGSIPLPGDATATRFTTGGTTTCFELHARSGTAVMGSSPKLCAAPGVSFFPAGGAAGSLADALDRVAPGRARGPRWGAGTDRGRTGRNRRWTGCWRTRRPPGPRAGWH